MCVLTRRELTIVEDRDPLRHFGMTTCIARALVAAALLALVGGRQPAWAGEPQATAAQGTAVAPSPSPPRRVELFGGYTYSPELDEYKIGSEAGHGFAIALTVNLAKYVGLVVDADWQSWTDHGDLDRIDPATVGCSYPTSYAYCATYRGDQNVSLFYLSFGPRVHVRRGAFTAFGLAAGEIQRSWFSEQELAYVLTVGGVELDTLQASTAGAWGFGFGGGADLALGRRFAVRLLQVNYSLGGYGQGPGRQFRIKTGIVVRFN
jgi:hypothetical protein